MSSHNMKWVFAIAILVLFATSAAYAQVLQSVDSLVVVDANEKRVGKAIGMIRSIGGDAAPVVVFNVDGHVFIVGVLEDSFESISKGMSMVNFESTDCTGTAFIRDDSGSVLSNVVINLPGNTVYVEDPYATVKIVSVMSFLDYNHKCHSVNYDSDLIQAIPLINLDALFTAPFSVQVDEDQNGSLQQQITDLQEDLSNHSHSYLSGIGEGHNNTKASTGPATFPAVP